MDIIIIERSLASSYSSRSLLSRHSKALKWRPKGRILSIYHLLNNIEPHNDIFKTMFSQQLPYKEESER